jgi:hypothetical protein
MSESERPLTKHGARDLERLAAWKAKGRPIAVVLISREETTSEAIAYRTELTKAQRLARAASGLALSWVFAAAAVVAHFALLAPVFLIAGPVIAWWRYKHTSVVLGGLAECPRCRAPMRIKKAAESWPISASCDDCRAIVRVERAASA